MGFTLCLIGTRLRRADGGVRLHPDNPSFADEDVRPGLIVLGRQVWRGG